MDHNPYAQCVPAPQEPVYRPYWVPTMARPSLALVVVATLFLGVFGAIFAHLEAQKARQWGEDPEIYWTAWVGIWFAEMLVAIVLFTSLALG